MISELATALKLSRWDQVGLVVHDLDAAVKNFEPLLGEFNRINPGNMRYFYLGENTDVDMSVATAQYGNVQIEIIAVNSGSSPHSELP